MRLFPLVFVLALTPLVALQAGTTPPPVTSVQNVPPAPPNHSRVSYGQDPAQVMDVWFAKSDKPTPVVVYIHGGGWEGGSRQSIQTRGLNPLLEAGISVVAIDYRLITPAIKAGINPPVQWPMRDAARAIQFIRSKASEWNLDKSRLGLTGGSAGACTSLWLAMHEDLADPKSEDPVSRESTRVSCAGVWDAQTSLDPQQIYSWFKVPTYGAHAFGIVKDKNGRWTSDMEAGLAQRDRILPWIKEYSPIEHASSDDPPIFLSYTASPQPAGQPQLDSVHGAAFGIHLKERLDVLGVECHVVHPVLPTDPNPQYIQFLIQKLTEKGGDKNATDQARQSPRIQPLHDSAGLATSLPAPGAIVYSPHPHFQWKREMDVKIDDIHHIQIARDEAFAQLVCDDRLEVVSRFVPVNALLPGKYWWRVRRGECEWSKATAFEVRAPEQVFTIRAGSNSETVARVLQDAASHCPARVDFEPGEYRLGPKDAKVLVTVVKAHDLIIDGHGAQLTLTGTLLVLNDCQRVTLEHFTITPSRPGHTLVRVVKKDPATEQLIVKPEPGYETDVPHYFDMTGSGGSFLGCMDSLYHGKYIPGGGISARSVNVKPAKDDSGAFVFSPVKAATLDLFPIGAVAVATSYHWQWVQMNRTEECTFSEVTVSDLPGAFCGGSNNSARSYLSCKVKPRTPNDYFGGHAATGSGRIGEWIEGCEFECLPDDGPAEQSFRQPIKGTEGVDTILAGGTAIREGDRLALVDAKTGRGVSTVAKSAKAGRVQLDRPLGELAAAIGYDASRGWKNVFLYCDSPSNEDFVYRRNRTVGGRAHGVKFNGTRAWISDNHFENINGNAVLAGYTSEVSGHGARDVVVSGNSIVRCGWTPINVWSTSGLGGNIVIRENHITETKDSAIAVKGCDGVTITGNTFTSSTLPKQGFWITAEKTMNLRTAGNEYPAGVPELNVSVKTTLPAK